MSRDADHRRAVVTGASRGLGLEWVRQLLATGWSVIAATRRPEASPQLGELLAKHAGRLELMRLDVADSTAAVAAFAHAVAERWDGIDLLVNNAGVNQAGTDRAATAGPLPHVDADALTAVLRINTVSPVVITAALAPMLARAGGATVVNTSSRLGSLHIASSPDDPYEADYAYRVSKAALNMATIALAKELAAQGTVVVAMSPGWVRTDMTSHQTADLSVEESVSGQLATAISLTAADSGRYLAHTGESIPW